VGKLLEEALPTPGGRARYMKERRQKRRRLRTLVTGGAVGAAIAYFFDPDRGKGRRTRARDWTAARVRRAGRKAERLRRRTGAEVYGTVQRAAHLGAADPNPDDVTLKHKVETELFGRTGFPKGDIIVDVNEGVVALRGQVSQPERVKDIEARTRKIVGVHDVRNLLHPPRTPAPNKRAAREAIT
jgi:gas vesicle protein